MRRIIWLSASLLIASGLAVAVRPIWRSSAAVADRSPSDGVSEVKVRVPSRSLSQMHQIPASLRELTERCRAATSDERERIRAEFEALLARSDPAELLRSVSADLLDPSWLNIAFQLWVDRSPGEALAWLQAQSQPELYSHLRNQASTAWAREKPEAALQWTLDQAEGNERDHLLARIAIGYAERDPNLADAFAHKLLPPGEARQHALEGIAVAWAAMDPAAAATWALNATSSEVERQPVDLVLYSWFDENPMMVRAWVRDLPTAKERDLLWWRLLHWQAEKNPAQAGAILNEMSDDTLRAQAARDLVGLWARQDFDVAGEWVLRAPAPLRAQLLAELETIATEPPAMFP